MGFCSDLLVRAGATVMFSEVTEVRDAWPVHARAATPEVAQRHGARDGLVRRLPGARQRDRSANTTPGNKKGGLSNIVEKAMGSIIKSAGADRRRGVARRTATAGIRGPLYAATPSDFICGTLQLAAGMNLHRLHHRSRGTPYGLAAVPVLKVATRSELARRWHDLMDLDAGPHRRRRGHHRERGLGMFPPAARRGQRPAHLGRSTGSCTTTWCCSTRRR